MADAQTKLRQQHAHASNALNYGHLGTATYVERSARWAFLRTSIETSAENHDSIDHEYRRPPVAFPFELVDDATKVVVDGEQIRNQAKDHDAATNPFRSRHRLLSNFPEVVPAVADLNYAEASNIRIHDAFDRNDCLTFGGAAMVVDTGKTHRTIPIAALTAGSNAGSVRLVCIGKESLSLPGIDGIRRMYWLPTVSAAEDGWWTGSGGEVLQISFAASQDHKTGQSTWMAVRQQSCTTLFHPLLHRMPVPAPTAQQQPSVEKHPASRLDANPILALPMSRTGGHSQADVQFHPQDHKTLALIDERGNWSVWKVEGRRATTGHVTYRISLLYAGSLSSWDEIEPPLSTPLYHDGWHRVCWLNHSDHETDRLLVCNRTTAGLYHSQGMKLGPVDLWLGLKTHSQWLLDVKRSSTNPSHCYFLTSTKLMLMSASNEDWTDPTGLQSLSLVLSWQHFRSRADFSLCLNLLETNGSTTVLISSDMNAILIVFRLGLLEDLPMPVSIADPAQLYLPFQTDSQKSVPGRILDLRFLQIQQQPDDPNGLQNPVLFKLFLGRTDGQIEEILYRCTEPNIASTFNQPYSNVIVLPSLRAVNARAQSVQRKSKKYAGLEDLGEFVVPDDPELEGDNDVFPKSVSCQSETDPDFEDQSPKNTRDWEDIYDLLEEERNDSASRPRTDLETLLADIRQNLDQRPPENIQTLSNLADAIPYVAEADAGSSILRAFVEGDLSVPDLQIDVLGLPGYSHDILLDCYNQLTQSWLRSLPPSTSDRQRVNKERLCRAVAADVALASVTIRPKPAEPTQEMQLPEDLQSSPLSSPSSSTLALASPLEEAAITRLRAYTSITKPIPSISTSRTLTSLLAHLPADPNADPADYDYRATEARLNVDADQSQIDPKVRRRAERIANQQRRRIEAQKQMSQALREKELGGGVPGIVSSQTPVEGNQMGIGHSTQALAIDKANLPAVMTQPERGLFGTRSVSAAAGKKGKGKERRQGF